MSDLPKPAANELEPQPHDSTQGSGSMRKWLWLTARKQSKTGVGSKKSDNDAAQAAADAIAQMLGKAERNG